MPLNSTDSKFQLKWKGNTSTSLQPAMDMRLRIYQCWWWLLASMRSLFSFSNSVTVWWEGRWGDRCLVVSFKIRLFFFERNLLIYIKAFDLECFFNIQLFFQSQVCLFFLSASWLLTVKFRPTFSDVLGITSTPATDVEVPCISHDHHSKQHPRFSCSLGLVPSTWMVAIWQLGLFFPGMKLRAWSVTRQLEKRLMKAHQCCFLKHLFDWYCGFSFINVVFWLLTFLHNHWVQCSGLPIFAYAGIFFLKSIHIFGIR